MGVVKIRATALVLLAGAGVLAPGPARAHPEIVPTLVNRYIALTVFEARTDVLVSLLFGQLPGGERRRLMDLDHDGRIDAREVSRERLSWGRDPGRLIHLSVDGSPVHLVAASVLDLNGDPTVSLRPLLVELRGSFDLAPGERRLIVEAGADLPRLGETEIAIDLVAGWDLLSSLDANERPTDPPRRLFQFPAASAGRTPARASFLLRARPGAAPTSGRWGSAAWGLLAAAAAATLTLAFLALRPRRPA